MKKVKPAAVKSDDRPDIIVFNRPIAVVDTAPDYGSVVIFEFKRAMRDDYTEGDNPVLQVINYVKKLKTGKEVDRNGRPIPTGENTQYYGYVVCDITDKLRELAELYGLKPTPDGKGYFGPHPSGVYLEVVPFWKLIEDARKRNERLFELLGFRSAYNAPLRRMPVAAGT